MQKGHQRWRKEERVFEELGKKSVWRGENSQHEIHLGISNFFFYKMQLSHEIQT